MIVLILILIVILTLIIIYNKVIKIKNIVIENKKIKENVKIIFISDLHFGKYLKKKEFVKIINKINKLNGDYLLVGGDLIGQWFNKYYSDEEVKSLFNLINIKDKYFVRGNHDLMNYSFYDEFKILNDDIVELASNIKLIGLDWDKKECLDYKLNRDTYNILLSHYPDRFLEYSKIDLALAGHSHGRQVNLPFCNFHHKEKYKKGLYSFENKKVYVNRGLGFSFLKIRLFSFREIVKIELRK